MSSVTLSLHLDPETRRLLDEDASARRRGASTLAREIVEREVRALRDERVRRQVVPATAALAADPSVDLSFALAWNVQAVPHERTRETLSHVTAAQLASLRRRIAACIGIE